MRRVRDFKDFSFLAKREETGKRGKLPPKMKKREKNLPRSKRSFLQQLLYTYC